MCTTQPILRLSTAKSVVGTCTKMVSQLVKWKGSFGSRDISRSECVEGTVLDPDCSVGKSSQLMQY